MPMSQFGQLKQQMKVPTDTHLDAIADALLGRIEPTPQKAYGKVNAANSNHDGHPSEKSTDYSTSTLDALKHLGMSKADYEAWQKTKNKVNRGTYFTAKDKDILMFLALSKYSTDSIVAYSQGITVHSSQKHLRRLIGKKQVKRLTIPGVKPLFALTKLGMELSGYDFELITEKSINLQSIQPTLGASYILSEYWSRTHDFISEQEIRRSLGKMNDRTQGIFRVIAGKALAMWNAWNKKPEDSPELKEDGLFLYALPNDGMLNAPQYHVPDLVIVQSRNENGEAKSIAVEIERTLKTVEQYTRIMTAYKQDKYLYGKIIWYVTTDGIGKRIAEGCKRAGIPKDKSSIHPITVKDEHGNRTRYRGGDFTKI